MKISSGVTVLSNGSTKFVENNGEKAISANFVEQEKRRPIERRFSRVHHLKNADFEVMAAIITHKNAKVKLSDVDNLHIISYNICR